MIMPLEIATGRVGFVRASQRRISVMWFKVKRLSTWSRSQILSQMATFVNIARTVNPRLAMALLQVLAQRRIYLAQRIESFSRDTIERRVARALIRFSERFGTRGEDGDGSIRMPAFTHEVLSQYVGTTHETITDFMVEFRRKGFIEYSRREIVLYRAALREWTGQE
jgi:CRP-like cAMP-binding protein